MRAEEAPEHAREVPYLAIAAAVVAWGIGPLLVRAISASPITISFYRLWLAVPVTGVVAWLTGTPISWRVLRASWLAGVLFAVSILFAFASFQQTSVANATLIPALQPILVLLVAGRLFGESIGRTELLLGGVSIIGIAAVVVGADGMGGATLGGDLMAIGNLIAFTAYFLVIKQRRTEGYAAGGLLAGSILWAAIVVTPVALLVSDDLGAVEGIDWFYIVLMVAIPGTIGHGLMNWAQRYVDVTISSLLTLANPVVSTMGAWIIYDQALNKVQVLGATLVLASLAAIVVAQRRPDEIVAEPLE